MARPLCLLAARNAEMSDALGRIRDIIQEDVGRRGLRKDPASNLITATADDFSGACRSIAEHPRPAVAVVTGFYIPTAHPPSGETDGPLGAVFLDQVPPEHQDRCHTMRGRDITTNMSPAHWLFEAPARRGVATIGIGDGGNEIGMGRIPWDIIQRNIPNGGLVACRTATEQLIV